MPNILVIDVGTSSMRGTLFHENGQTLRNLQLAYTPEYFDDGRVEQNPKIWSDCLIRITASIVQWASEQWLSIDALALTSQRSSAIPVDSRGNPLHDAIMWQDTRTSGLCKTMHGHMAKIYSLTGLRISPVLAAPKFSWFKKERPDIYNRSHRLLTIADYLVFQMTGRFVTDHTYGSRTLLMNLHSLSWDSELLGLFDIDSEKLCDLAPQGSILGVTTDGFHSLTGLPSGTPVVSAGGDQQCGALGAGILNAGSIQITTGTGSYVIASSDRLSIDPHMQILCSVAAVPGQFILESSILTTAALYSWIGNTLYSDTQDAAERLRRLGEDAASSDAGANGVILLPYFQGRGSPDWNSDASGMFANVTLATTRGNLVRSVLEGIAAEVAENVKLMLGALDGDIRLLISGGLSNLPLFNQIQADMFNLNVCAPSNKETTSLGAWLSAAVAIGIHPSYAEAFRMSQQGPPPSVYTPVLSNVEVYSQLMDHRTYLYRTLKHAGLYKRLRDFSSSVARNG